MKFLPVASGKSLGGSRAQGKQLDFSETSASELAECVGSALGGKLGGSQCSTGREPKAAFMYHLKVLLLLPSFLPPPPWWVAERRQRDLLLGWPGYRSQPGEPHRLPPAAFVGWHVTTL